MVSLPRGTPTLVAASADRLVGLDFKTDTPPGAPVEIAYPASVGQARAYGQLLSAAGPVGQRTLQYGRLFTADGSIRWLE